MRTLYWNFVTIKLLKKKLNISSVSVSSLVPRRARADLAHLWGPCGPSNCTTLAYSIGVIVQLKIHIKWRIMFYTYPLGFPDIYRSWKSMPAELWLVLHGERSPGFQTFMSHFFLGHPRTSVENSTICTRFYPKRPQIWGPVFYKLLRQILYIYVT